MERGAVLDVATFVAAWLRDERSSEVNIPLANHITGFEIGITYLDGQDRPIRVMVEGTVK